MHSGHPSPPSAGSSRPMGVRTTQRVDPNQVDHNDPIFGPVADLLNPDPDAEVTIVDSEPPPGDSD